MKDVKANRFAFIVQFDDFSIQTFGYPSYGGNTTRYPLPKNVVGESIYADADGSLGLVTSNGTAMLFGKLASTIKPHAQCELAGGVETLFEGRNWLHKKKLYTMGNVQNVYLRLCKPQPFHLSSFMNILRCTSNVRIDTDNDINTRTLRPARVDTQL